MRHKEKPKIWKARSDCTIFKRTNFTSRDEITLNPSPNTQKLLAQSVLPEHRHCVCYDVGVSLPAVKCDVIQNPLQVHPKLRMVPIMLGKSLLSLVALVTLGGPYRISSKSLPNSSHISETRVLNSRLDNGQTISSHPSSSNPLNSPKPPPPRAKTPYKTKNRMSITRSYVHTYTLPTRILGKG
ncbi:uncharacterized protein BDR25DRAFT_363217 [Lindgomyces ingoldianus]|uniref:Uncharacterized protein n=1 Tax=Lindgomyces ingoldianus TaxID=673940 RepID=A0ACB6Q843_9PLEO|nr:uncharacterized protein BDR25DRAFT_363217 [Lindgomyces ingoldianus]KAF2463020.1 hypothetical protein BDR25DRAFT_363217 [Lindgomyces ingoldianus]